VPPARRFGRAGALREADLSVRPAEGVHTLTKAAAFVSKVAATDSAPATFALVSRAFVPVAATFALMARAFALVAATFVLVVAAFVLIAAAFAPRVAAFAAKAAAFASV
jgi:hypothetical protein